MVVGPTVGTLTNTGTRHYPADRHAVSMRSSLFSRPVLQADNRLA